MGDQMGPIRQLFTLGSGLKITEIALILELLFYTVPIMY
jgi:hypothetical protein